MAARSLVCPIVKRGPRLDGKLDDAEWKQAVEITGMTDLAGKRRAPQQTTLRMLRTGKALYIAVRAEEPHIKDPSFFDAGYTYPLRIDPEPSGYLWWFESVEIFFDPGRDRRDVTQIMLNPYGLKEGFVFDSVRYGFYGKENDVHKDWPVEGYCNMLDDAWTLEFRVPLSAFGKEAEAPLWGFNICRNRRLRVGNGMKYSTWTPLAWGFQDAKNFGKLTFANGE
ncbi:MAG: sugar-binding protein [Planctomycetota bacterium]|jgi:hypothetical protein|nr:sugar-binding protein [Planctomycetota bacterium]MDP7132933.1 sugar-binding protein [Planctomycetota bacterium]